jgi:hypothetical protein
MSLLKSRNVSLIIIALLVACAHDSGRDRQPSALSATGLGDAALQKKLDEVFKSNGMIQKLSAKGAAENSGIAVAELRDNTVEGSVFGWQDSESKETANTRLSRLVIGKIVHPNKKADEGNYYTHVSGVRSGSADASLSQLHLSSTGSLLSFTKCEMLKGSTELRCLEVNEDSCWTLFKPKSLVESPTKQVDWKAQACAMAPSLAASLNEIFAEASEWGESSLTKDNDMVGVGHNRFLFTDILEGAFSKHQSTKSPDGYKALVAGVQKLECSISEVRSSEESTIADYIKLMRPIAVECQRLQKIFPNFGWEQAVASEGKRTRASTATHSAAPVKQKKKPSNQKTRWIWQK